jgi:DNA polymerase III delta subunit
MLNLYYGNDVVKARQEALKMVDGIQVAHEVTVHRIESGQFAVGLLAQMLGAASLFGGGELYVLDTPSEDEVFFEALLKVLSEMAESSNYFIVMEGTMLAPERKKFEKHAGAIEEFKKTAETPFNVWAMADALAARDKKSLWVLLQDARRAGLAAEEIIGTFWWQLKTLRLATLTKEAGDAGMKDFPFNKAKRSLSNFKTGEIESLSRGLLKVYHDGHGGVRDIDEGLEEWVLRG